MPPLRFARLALFAACLLAGCEPAPKELSGRPLVLKLGAQISTATTAESLDNLAARVAASSLDTPVREHLGRALDTQRRLLGQAAEMDLNTRIQTTQAVLTHIEAASQAVK